MNVENYINLLWDKQVDELLLYEPFQPSYLPTLKRIVQNQIPVVSLLFPIEELDPPAVLVDHKRGALLATQNLIDLGHRSLLYLSARNADRHGFERDTGYREIVERERVASQIINVAWDWKKASKEVYAFF